MLYIHGEKMFCNNKLDGELTKETHSLESDKRIMGNIKDFHKVRPILVCSSEGKQNVPQALMINQGLNFLSALIKIIFQSRYIHILCG